MSRIDSEYAAQVRSKIDLALRHARTDREAWAILQRLREETAAGMTWDEQGIRRHLSDYQTQPATDQDGRKRSQNSGSREFLWGLALFIGVIFWLGGQWITGNRPDTAQDQIDLVRIDSGSERPQEIGQPVMLEIIGPQSNRVWLPIVADPQPQQQSREPIARWDDRGAIHYPFEIDTAVWEEIHQGTRLWLQMEHGPSRSFVCQAQNSDQPAVNTPSITLLAASSHNRWWCPYDFNLEPHPQGDVIGMHQWGEIDPRVSIRVGRFSMIPADENRLTIRVEGSLRGVLGTNETVSFRLIGENETLILGQSPPHRVFGETGEWRVEFEGVPHEAGSGQMRLQVISGQGHRKLIDLGTAQPPVWHIDQQLWREDKELGLLIGELNWSVTEAQWISADSVQAWQGETALSITTTPALPFHMPKSGQPVQLSIPLEPDNRENIILEIGQKRWLIEQPTINSTTQ